LQMNRISLNGSKINTIFKRKYVKKDVYLSDLEKFTEKMNKKNDVSKKSTPVN